MNNLLKPPSSEELEAALIASIMAFPPGVDDIDPPLTANDFLILKYGYVWDAVTRLHNAGEFIDPVSVTAALTPQQRKTFGSEENALAQIGPLADHGRASVASIPTYARSIKQIARRRQWYEVGRRIAQLSCDELSGLETVDSEALRMVNEALSYGVVDDDGVVDFQDVVSQLFDDFETLRDGGEPTGLPLPFPTLNKYMRGLQPGELVVIAARPGEGKSTLLLQLAMYIAAKFKAAYAPYEMTPKENIKRVLAQEAGLDTIRQDSFDDKAFAVFTRWMQESGNRNVRFIPKAAATPLKLGRIARREQRKNGLDALFVDYIQLMDADVKTENRASEISKITKYLKSLAMELNIPVVAAAQMNRNIEYASRPPRKSDLKGSGSIEDDADKILFIWDPNKKDDEDSLPDFQSREPRPVKFVLGKHRNGPEGIIDMLFMPERIRFEELAKDIR